MGLVDEPARKRMRVRGRHVAAELRADKSIVDIDAPAWGKAKATKLKVLPSVDYRGKLYIELSKIAIGYLQDACTQATTVVVEKKGDGEKGDGEKSDGGKGDGEKGGGEESGGEEDGGEEGGGEEGGGEGSESPCDEDFGRRYLEAAVAK